MSADEVVHDERADVFRIRTAAGILLGAEYGGDPLAFDSARQACDMVERRRDLHEHLVDRKARR